MIGATGAVGGHCLTQLINDSRVEKITLLNRRNVEGISSEKVSQHIVDLENLNEHKGLFENHNIAICTLGVGEPSKASRDYFKNIDYNIPLSFALLCKEANIEHFELLSSVSANAKSPSYYLKLKGMLNQAIEIFEFKRFSIFHPSMIITPTNRYGLSQAIVLKVWPYLNHLLVGPLSKYKGIKVDQLGNAIANNIFFTDSEQAVEHMHFKEFLKINNL